MTGIIGRKKLHMFIEEIHNINSSEKDLRSFGRTLGIFFGILALVFLWHHPRRTPWCAGLAAFFLLFGFLYPKALKPVQKVWMTMALLMGWVMTRLLLGILFYGVITPIGLILRMSGKDFMSRKWSKDAGTYWIDRSVKRDSASYETQY